MPMYFDSLQIVCLTSALKKRLPKNFFIKFSLILKTFTVLIFFCNLNLIVITTKPNLTLSRPLGPHLNLNPRPHLTLSPDLT